MDKKEVVYNIISVLLPVMVVGVLLNFVFLVANVESASMEPTLMTGNIVVYNRLAYKNREVQRGDVIAFRDSETRKLIGKRVIGVPGDEISFKDGYVVLNGKFVDETDYIDEDVETNCVKTFTVPNGCIFVLGDNRENSNDSRFWENPYVAIDNIEGLFMRTFSFRNNSNEKINVPINNTIGQLDVYSADLDDELSSPKILTDLNVEKKDTSKAYTSSVYNMLSIGDNGILPAVNYDLNEIELPVICIKNVYRGDDAEKIIRDYCSSGSSIYTYFDALEGCHWEAIKYELNYRDCKAEDYIDIRVIGIDGNKLKFGETEYPMRTYNIDNHVIQDGNWRKGYYVFYAIPNGCTDYALMCGDYIEGSGVYPAYFEIKDKHQISAE